MICLSKRSLCSLGAVRPSRAHNAAKVVSNYSHYIRGDRSPCQGGLPRLALALVQTLGGAQRFDAVVFLRATPRFARLLKSLVRRHREVSERYAEVLNILGTAPSTAAGTIFSSSRGLHSETSNIASLGRWRFRYGLSGRSVRSGLHAWRLTQSQCSLLLCALGGCFHARAIPSCRLSHVQCYKSKEPRHKAVPPSPKAILLAKSSRAMRLAHPL